MYLIYNILLLTFSVVFLPVILTAFAVQPKFRAGFFQKIGFYKSFRSRPSIWVHAVSVGEVNAVENFVKRLYVDFPDFDIVLSTVTRTGREVAHKKLSGHTHRIIYFPYDFIFSVKSAINALNPAVAIIAETEIWPNFSKELKNKNIPLLLINGRISPSSHRGYKKLRIFFKKVFENYSSVLMQSKGDMERIIDIGANPEKTKVMGNLKFEISGLLSFEQIQELKNALKKGSSKILIAGSTHRGEDEIILDAYKKLKTEIPELKMILAPRHPERNNDVLQLISASSFSYGKKSNNSTLEDCEILLLDTMGELGKLYSIADVAFIGGGFSGTGGHNPLEAAVYNVPVVSGATVFNFKDIYRYLTDAKAAFLAENPDELHSILKNLLTDAEFYAQSSNACKSVFDANKGATDYALNEIRQLLKR
jgi:3-deoxy-D-manno-octulosonic-acid transferase